MDEYVAKQEVIDALGKWVESREDWAEHPAWFARDIMSIESKDVAPVIHAKWIINNERDAVCCSNCMYKKHNCADEIRLLDTAFRGLNYCEYRGAKMIGAVTVQEWMQEDGE